VPAAAHIVCPARWPGPCGRRWPAPAQAPAHLPKLLKYILERSTLTMPCSTLAASGPCSASRLRSSCTTMSTSWPAACSGGGGGGRRGGAPGRQGLQPMGQHRRSLPQRQLEALLVSSCGIRSAPCRLRPGAALAAAQALPPVPGARAGRGAPLPWLGGRRCAPGPSPCSRR
jgi:hypothetical protein